MNLDKLTYAVRGAAFAVSNELGCGFLEKVYQNALRVELQALKIGVEVQKPLSVCYKGVVVKEYIADMLVEKRIIVEVKTVSTLTSVHEAQLLNYLHATGVQVGLLMNFSQPKVHIKRLVLEFPR